MHVVKKLIVTKLGVSWVTVYHGFSINIFSYQAILKMRITNESPNRMIEKKRLEYGHNTIEYRHMEMKFVFYYNSDFDSLCGNMG